MTSKTILTSSKEIYDKLNMLNFFSEVVIRETEHARVEKILSNINKNGNILKMEMINNDIHVRKLNPINYSVYMQKPQKYRRV